MPYLMAAKSREGAVELLKDLKRKLQAAYPNCAPLRQQLHRIDMSVSQLGRAKSADG